MRVESTDLRITTWCASRSATIRQCHRQHSGTALNPVRKGRVAPGPSPGASEARQLADDQTVALLQHGHEPGIDKRAMRCAGSADELRRLRMEIVRQIACVVFRERPIAPRQRLERRSGVRRHSECRRVSRTRRATLGERRYHLLLEPPSGSRAAATRLQHRRLLLARRLQHDPGSGHVR